MRQEVDDGAVVLFELFDVCLFGVGGAILPQAEGNPNPFVGHCRDWAYRLVLENTSQFEKTKCPGRDLRGLAFTLHSVSGINEHGHTECGHGIRSVLSCAAC